MVVGAVAWLGKEGGEASSGEPLMTSTGPAQACRSNARLLEPHSA
jgi:hypothetical protein